ncbi:ankyrin repeat-containing domain protein [Truncatella angustata]|uniref:Ankyrin repeat-containing domain protein n=1 Tax=Truncatella angustata TaxID=152316 RepID=A0A9P8UC11_9PEZI|nr:ankyrin repeat-containing domain protein [Truncatella angustata]KAH6645590.1 ankyrin repeat-containing domain protein [Truncatella angustata]
MTVANKDGSTPIYVAASNGYLDIVKFFLENNADIMIANKDGRTPAYGAAVGGHLDVVRFLLNSNADSTFFWSTRQVEISS